jgi:hypothetical protein
MIWRKSMFKENFNALAVAIEEFAIKDRTKPNFEKVADQVSYYRTIVDEYYYIDMNLNNLLTEIDSNLYPDLVMEITNAKTELETYFTPYKDEYIVSTYIKELEAFGDKNSFFERLFKFEKMLVEKPIIKIENDILQDLLVYIRKYSSVTEKYYFFANNPFDIDSELGIIIPQKFEYDTADKLVNGVYNYIYGLYNTYRSINEVELSNLDAVEQSIREKIFQLNEDIRQAKKQKIYVEFDTQAEEFYDKVNVVKLSLENSINNIVVSGVYRFYSLSKEFKDVESQYNIFISEYINHPLYKEYILNKDYNNKLDNLQEFIYLLEDGKINEDKEYILTDINLKTLVEEIIELSRENKKKIYYTQKFHETGISTLMEYEFYQTEQFLNDIKKYYYELMTENIYKHSKLTIDDFGDGSVLEYKLIYKNTLAKYEQFLAQEQDFMNDFEVQEYIASLEEIQNKLKIAAMNFFDAAIKTSPLTFTETIETMYRNLLDKLSSDLVYVKENSGLDLIKLNVDPNRQIALEKLRDISTHITKLEHVIYLSKKYVFLDMTSFIETNIYTPYNNFYIGIKESFNKEEYIKVIADYDNFYKESIFDFNMLFSLEKLADSTENIFGRIELLNSIYIDEQINERPSEENPDQIDFVNDLFDDETYKVVRNELFSQLDIYYEFVIAMRSNEKPFLVNEKNLKKVYFDNQFMKLNYIRLYHKVISERQTYINLIDSASKYDWFENEKQIIEKFDYKERLETLILNQNRILSEVTKMIVEYGSDNNFNTVDVSSEAILDIQNYNKMAGNDIDGYIEAITRISEFNRHEKLMERFHILVNEHEQGWNELVITNEIPAPEEVSYLEMETFKGTVPYLAEFEAKVETILNVDDEEETATFIWDFGNGILKEGNKVSYTFYEEGKFTVKCEMKYSSGESTTRFLEFDISGPTNSQVVKSHIFNYAPASNLDGKAMITYFDADEMQQISVPIDVVLSEGTIVDAIGSGSLTVSESDSELVEDRAGLVILGFEGVEFAGEPFDNKTIYGEGFEMPEEAEFLFDFKVSDPIMNRTVIDITKSKFIEYVAKVPKDDYESIYAIDDASRFQPLSGTTYPVMVGDLLIMKNKMGRYAVVEISKIYSDVELEVGQYYFAIDFNTHVNVSLNRYDRNVFKPLETQMVVPTLMFKTNVRELFSSLVARLEEIDKLNAELATSNDMEKILTLKNKIETLEYENSKYYLFEEYNKLKAKVIGYNQLRDSLWEICTIPDDIECIVSMKEINDNLEAQMNSTKTADQYMNSIHVYEFKKNIVDMTIISDLYKDQLLAMEILIDTYNFRTIGNCDHFREKINNLKYMPNECKIELENANLPYEEKVALLVLKMRDFIFKIKLIVNFPILSEGKHILFSQVYLRPHKNEETGEYEEVSDPDFYLLNKKLEMKIGYETDKVELGALYTDFVEDLVMEQKKLFGNGLSDEELDNLGKYVQVVETKAVEEYDDFFMIPFWIDYLKKSV